MAAWHLRSWVHFLVLKEKGQTTNASSWCAHFTLPLEDNPSFLLHLFLKQQIISLKKINTSQNLTPVLPDKDRSQCNRVNKAADCANVAYY